MLTSKSAEKMTLSQLDICVLGADYIAPLKLTLVLFFGGNYEVFLDVA